MSRLSGSRYDRPAEAEAPGGSRAPEPRDQLRLAEGDRAGARPWGPPRELRIQGGARAAAIRVVAPVAPAPAALQAVERHGARHSDRPRRIRLARHGPGHRDQAEGGLRAHAWRVHRRRGGRRRAAGLHGLPPRQGAGGGKGRADGDDHVTRGHAEAEDRGPGDGARSGGRTTVSGETHKCTWNTIGPVGAADPARGSRLIATPVTAPPSAGIASVITIGSSCTIGIRAALRIPPSVMNQIWYASSGSFGARPLHATSQRCVTLSSKIVIAPARPLVETGI